MAKINIKAGDFETGASYYSPLLCLFKLRTAEHSITGEGVKLEQFELIELADEDSVKRVGGTVGWGVAGAVILGPVGLLAGMLLGGRGKRITFVGRLKDGRKLLAETDKKTWQKIQAALF